MKLIIAGSRGLNISLRQVDEHVKLFEEELDRRVTEVFSGLARGPDLAGHAWATRKGIVVREYAADWEKYGKRAGIIRNQMMGNSADALLAFYDGESRGTKHMLEYMYSFPKPVMLVSCSP